MEKILRKNLIFIMFKLPGMKMNAHYVNEYLLQRLIREKFATQDNEILV